MIKLNLQLFALVKDARGDQTVVVKKKKKKTIPKIPTDNTVVAKVETPVVTDKLDPVGTGNNKMPDFLKMDDAQLDEQRRRNKLLTSKEDLSPPFPVKETVTETETTTPVETGPTPEQLRQDLLRLEEQAKLADLSRSSDLATQAVRDREELIAPKIKGLKSTASVSTQLAGKRLKDIFAATGTEAGAGVARQIAGEQGLQSQLGALDVQEAQERAQVAKDISDIQSEKAFLERQIRAGTATAETQAQLESLQAEQEAAARAAEINSEREFKLFEKSLDQFNELEIINLKDAIDKENTALDAEIQRLENVQLFEQDSALKAQAAEDARRLQGIKNSNSLKLASINNAAAAERITAKGEEDRLTAEFKDTLDTSLNADGTPKEEPDKFPDSTFTANISKQLQGTDEFTPVEDVNQIIALGIMDQVRQGNITNETQLQRLLTRYNLTEAEVDAILEAEQRTSTPGVGGLNLP